MATATVYRNQPPPQQPTQPKITNRQNPRTNNNNISSNKNIKNGNNNNNNNNNNLSNNNNNNANKITANNNTNTSITNNPENNTETKPKISEKPVKRSLVKEAYSTLDDYKPRPRIKPAKPKRQTQPRTRRVEHPTNPTNSSNQDFNTTGLPYNSDRDTMKGPNSNTGHDVTVPDYNNINDSNDDTNTLNTLNNEHHHQPVEQQHLGVSNSKPEVTGNGKSLEPPSVRQRYYEFADMEDVVRDKILTQLRDNGVAETKVSSLSAKIAQAVRDDVMAERKAIAPEVMASLTSVVNDHLDVILHQHRQHTYLGNLKPHDTAELAQIVLDKVTQIHVEIESTKSCLDKALKQQQISGGHTSHEITTPREGGGQQERSLIMTIREGIEQQKAQLEIVEEKLKKTDRERGEVEGVAHKHSQEIQLCEDENIQLKRMLTEADQDNETLVSKVKEQQSEWDVLQKTLDNTRRELEMTKKRMQEILNEKEFSNKEVTSLQQDKARLQVICDQRHKEIVHLRQPDKDVMYQMKMMNKEVTELRTQTRRLTEEKGLLKAKTQKMESALDESLKHRNKLTIEKDALFKENQDIRQKYRKLTLATPAQRSLPEIMTPRSNRSSSRNTTFLTSSRVHTTAGDSSVGGVRTSWSDDGQPHPTNSYNKLPPTHLEVIKDNGDESDITSIA